MPRFLFVFLLSLASQAVHAFPWYASGDNIRGASLMSPEERKQYVTRLQGMRSFGECTEYMQAHYIEIDKRAKAANTILPPIQGDPCEVMRRMGRFH
jgi:hypothetical protein